MRLPPKTEFFNGLLSFDPYAGKFDDPQSLHKYLYTHGDPINMKDPTGLSALLQGLAFNYARAEVAIAAGAGLGAIISGLVVAHQLSLSYYTAATTTTTVAVASAAGATATYRLADLIRQHAQELAKATEDAIADLAKATMKTIEVIKNLKLPIYPVFKSLMPNIYDFNVQALASRPDWFLLVYNGPGNKQLAAQNRAYVEATWGHLRASAPADYQLDEFPYASTAQGGRAGPAKGKMVPATQNSTQGILLSAFYRTFLGSKPGPFLVVPVPV